MSTSNIFFALKIYKLGHSDIQSLSLDIAIFLGFLIIIRNIMMYNLGTCLINSVQSPHLVKYLLENGANVDAGMNVSVFELVKAFDLMQLLWHNKI